MVEGWQGLVYQSGRQSRFRYITREGHHFVDKHLFEVVADHWRRLILSKGDDRLEPGARLPTQEEMAEQFGVSRIVVRQATDLLEAEGFIDKIQGGGMFVRFYSPQIREPARHYREDAGSPFAEEVIATGKDGFRYSNDFTHAAASAQVADRLGIAEGDPVTCTEYVSYANKDVRMVTVSYEPFAITGGTPVENPEDGPLLAAGLVARFASIGMRPTRIVEDVEIRNPRPSEIQRLKLRPGTPIYLVTRTAYHHDRVVETADILISGDQYKLRYTIDIPPMDGGHADD